MIIFLRTLILLLKTLDYYRGANVLNVQLVLSYIHVGSHVPNTQPVPRMEHDAFIRECHNSYVLYNNPCGTAPKGQQNGDLLQRLKFSTFSNQNQDYHLP